MCSTIAGGAELLVVVLLASGLLFSGAVGDVLAADGDSSKSISKPIDEQQQIPEPPDSFLNTEPSYPYQMVAHSDYNNRLLIQPQKQEHAAAPAFVTSLLPTVPPARKRATTNIPRRTRYSPAVVPPPVKDEDLPNRSLLTPSRYYDSYGEWHHDGGVDPAHWASQQPHGGGGGNWDWKPHPHHHHPHEHHGNVLAEIFDATAQYPPYHHHHLQHQPHGLLGLQLFVLLHPVLMLGAVSFLVCLVNAVLGLVDKVKLPLVRAQDRITTGGPSTTPAALRDGRGEHLLDQLYHQFLSVAIDRQQNQKNDSLLPERIGALQEPIRK